MIAGGKTCQYCGYRHIYDYIHQNMAILWPLHLEQVTSQTDGRVLSARVQQTTPGKMEGEIILFWLGCPDRDCKRCEMFL